MGDKNPITPTRDFHSGPGEIPEAIRRTKRTPIPKSEYAFYSSPRKFSTWIERRWVAVVFFGPKCLSRVSILLDYLPTWAVLAERPTFAPNYFELRWCLWPPLKGEVKASRRMVDLQRESVSLQLRPAARRTDGQRAQPVWMASTACRKCGRIALSAAFQKWENSLSATNVYSA